MRTAAVAWHGSQLLVEIQAVPSGAGGKAAELFDEALREIYQMPNTGKFREIVLDLKAFCSMAGLDGALSKFQELPTKNAAATRVISRMVQDVLAGMLPSGGQQ